MTGPVRRTGHLKKKLKAGTSGVFCSFIVLHANFSNVPYNPSCRTQVLRTTKCCSGVYLMKLKAAVIGIGFVGRAHVESLRRLGILVLGALGSSPETTASACKSLGLEKAYGSLEEIASDPAVDVVHLCTPNYLHF